MTKDGRLELNDILGKRALARCFAKKDMKYSNNVLEQLRNIVSSDISEMEQAIGNFKARQDGEKVNKVCVNGYILNTGKYFRRAEEIFKHRLLEAWQWSNKDYLTYEEIVIDLFSKESEEYKVFIEFKQLFNEDVENIKNRTLLDKENEYCSRYNFIKKKIVYKFYIL